MDGAARVDGMGSEAEQFGQRDNRLQTRQLTDPLHGGDGWRDSVMGNDARDGADYDMYEDTNSTVAYAVQLAMKDNDDWLVERALERIRRTHSEGHKNVTLSKRELEALERKRLQAAPDLAVDKNVKAPESSLARALPYPLDTSIHGTWARTTSASVGPQSSETTLRSPLQPPVSGSLNRPPLHAPPAVSRSYPDDHPRISTHQALHPRDPGNPGHNPLNTQRGLTHSGPKPYSNALSRSPFISSDLAALTAGSGVSRLSASGRSSPERPGPAGSGDEIPMVKVEEHKVPSSLIPPAGKANHQRTSRP